VRLTDRIGEIAQRILGPPNKTLSTRSQLRFGTNGSVAVDTAGPKAGTYFNHETGKGGGRRELIKFEAGIADEDIPDWLEREGFGAAKANGHNKATVVATYDYRDEQGQLLFQVRRQFPPKKFFQRAPDRRGGWKRDKDGKLTMKGTRMVPYHLPELVAAHANANGAAPRCILVEGEKDADRLREQWGLTATTNPGGANKWRSEYNKHFAGFDVVILPDNDDTGRQHAEDVARNLAPIAARVRIVELPGLSEKCDVSDWMNDGASQSDLETLIEMAEVWRAPQTYEASDTESNDFENWQPPPLDLDVCDAGTLLDEDLPPREWLLGVTFCKEFPSSIVGAGAVGKTALRIAQGLSVASGRSLTGEHVHHRCKVLFLCFEDSIRELKRRVKAAMLYHDLSAEDVRSWFFYQTVTGPDAKLLKMAPNGLRVPGKLGDWLREIITKLGVELVIFDPFIKTHSVSENDNSAIDEVVTILVQLGIELVVAVDFPHHVHKGQIEPGDADAGRGASAGKDAGRLVHTLVPMSPKDAESLGIKDQVLQRSLVRMDGAKVNIAPPAAEAIWFELVSVPLGNRTDRYPNGDHVQTVRRWYPPKLFDIVTVDIANQILDRIDEGPEPGRRYSPALQSKDRAVIPAISKLSPR
jgi:hypothetical protein